MGTTFFLYNNSPFLLLLFFSPINHLTISQIYLVTLGGVLTPKHMLTPNSSNTGKSSMVTDGVSIYAYCIFK